MRRPGRGPLRPVWSGPLGLHVPGSTLLHRTPAGVKLGALLVLGVAVVIVRGLVPALVATALALLAAAAVRMPLRRAARALVPVLLTAALVGAYQAWSRGWQVGAEVALDLVAVVLAAAAVTASSRADAMLAVVTRLMRPLRHVGIRPELVAVAMGVMLRSVPVLVSSTLEARDAARARGLGRSPRALLVPAAVRMVGHGYRTGEALAARGVVD